MEYFKLAKQNIGQENFDLVGFLGNLSPQNPVHEELCIKMTEFDLNSLRNCVLYNLLQQGLYLCPETSQHIIAFLQNDFSSLIKKIYIQVLVHYTKMDIRKPYEKYSTNFDQMPSGNKMSLDEYFDSRIASFVELAQRSACDVMEEVTSEKEISQLRTALLSPPILSAFQTCLNSIMRFSCTPEWIKTNIEKMRIYTVGSFTPLKGLRGACLIDGIVLCTSELGGGVPGAKKYEADAITLSAHECSHYLGRMMHGHFNFSTPFTGIAERKQQHDLVHPDLNLEAGRTTELVLFDMIQPDWLHSSEKAAIEFLKRLKTVEKCPILKAAEHVTLKLRARVCPSLSFGVDIEEHDMFC